MAEPCQRFLSQGRIETKHFTRLEWVTRVTRSERDLLAEVDSKIAAH